MNNNNFSIQALGTDDMTNLTQLWRACCKDSIRLLSGKDAVATKTKYGGDVNLNLTLIEIQQLLHRFTQIKLSHE